MSRFDRCKICDYNEQDGSVYSDAAPGSRGKVSLYPALDGSFCTVCIVEQRTNLVDLTFTTDPDEIAEKQQYNYSLFRATREADDAVEDV